jgi:hypothetical protein
MRVTYGHRQASDGVTEVSVRVEGNAGRFYALAGHEAALRQVKLGAQVRPGLATTSGWRLTVSQP